MTITPASITRKNEEVDRNLFIYNFYTTFQEFPKQKAITVLVDRFGLTERRIRAIIAFQKKKLSRRAK